MDLWSGKKHLKWSLIVRGKHVMGCFRVITFNVLFLCKLIKLSLLQIVIRMNKCEFMEFNCKFFFQKSFVITFVQDEWVPWDWDLARSGHQIRALIIIRCVTVCCPGVNHPEIGIVIESESLLTATLSSHHCLSRAPPPLLYGADGPEVSWHVTRGQYCAEMRILAMFYFRQRTPGAGFNWNLNDH